MKIIKNSLTELAHEIINMKYGRIVFDDGKFVNTFVPYPCHIADGIRYTVRAHEVTVISRNINKVALRAELAQLESTHKLKPTTIYRVNASDDPVFELSKCTFSVECVNIEETLRKGALKYPEKMWGDSLTTIVFDDSELFNLPSQTIIHEFIPNIFTGVDVAHNAPLLVTTFGHPLALYFNKVWRNVEKCMHANMFANLPMRVYEGCYDELQPPNKCYSCEQPLYEENYVLCSDNDKISLCVLCAHAEDTRHLSRQHIFRTHKTVYRAMFPDSYKDLLCDVENATVRDIFRDLCSGYEVVSKLHIAGNVLLYIETAKYIGLYDLDGYIINGLIASLPRDKKIFLLRSRRLIC